MTIRIALVVLAVGVGACGGPYQGKADKVPKVRRTDPPVAGAEGSPETPIVWDVTCNARFVATKASKQPAAAAPLVEAGDAALEASAGSDQAQQQIDAILVAIESYRKALLANHYDPAATFGLAVAYAQVRKKGCALEMLERLADLGGNPRLAGGEFTLDTWLDRVEREAAFSDFKTEAMVAIGR